MRKILAYESNSLQKIWRLRRVDPKSAAKEFLIYLQKFPNSLTFKYETAKKKSSFKFDINKELPIGDIPFTVKRGTEGNFIILVNTNQKGEKYTSIYTCKKRKRSVRLGLDVSSGEFVSVKKEAEINTFNSPRFRITKEYSFMNKLPNVTVDMTVCMSNYRRRFSFETDEQLNDLSPFEGWQEPKGKAYLFSKLMDSNFFDFFLNAQEVIKKNPKETMTVFATVFNKFMGFLDKLSIIHSVGIVHRDVRPHNMVLNEESEEIIDFEFSTMGDSRSLGCTRIFAAPEVEAKKKVGTPSDIWAMGCTLYFVSTNRAVPIDKQTRFSQFTKAVKNRNDKIYDLLNKHKQICILNLLTPELKSLLSEIILKTLSLDSKSRPTVQELYEELIPIQTFLNEEKATVANNFLLMK
jgi:serine/threonine protein kinase